MSFLGPEKQRSLPQGKVFYHRTEVQFRQRPLQGSSAHSKNNERIYKYNRRQLNKLTTDKIKSLFLKLKLVGL